LDSKQSKDHWGLLSKEQEPKTPPPLPSKSLPIFEDFLSSDFAEDTACAARKRKPTPMVAHDLRRSKRVMNVSKGFKSPSLSEARGKAKGRNSLRCSVSQKGKTHLFNISSDFPDLAAIDSMNAMGIHHPQISVFQLQRVGQEVCGLLPSEVTVDKLLRPEDAGSSGEGGNKLQVVING
jgi:hypothetical protein